jgi:hypothetical protein
MATNMAVSDTSSTICICIQTLLVRFTNRSRCAGSQGGLYTSISSHWYAPSTTTIYPRMYNDDSALGTDNS